MKAQYFKNAWRELEPRAISFYLRGERAGQGM
jgi:hypothetical protein